MRIRLDADQLAAAQELEEQLRANGKDNPANMISVMISNSPERLCTMDADNFQGLQKMLNDGTRTRLSPDEKAGVQRFLMDFIDGYPDVAQEVVRRQLEVALQVVSSRQPT